MPLKEGFFLLRIKIPKKIDCFVRHCEFTFDEEGEVLVVHFPNASDDTTNRRDLILDLVENQTCAIKCHNDEYVSFELVCELGAKREDFKPMLYFNGILHLRAAVSGCDKMEMIPTDVEGIQFIQKEGKLYGLKFEPQHVQKITCFKQ